MGHPEVSAGKVTVDTVVIDMWTASLRRIGERVRKSGVRSRKGREVWAVILRTRSCAMKLRINGQPEETGVRPAALWVICVFQEPEVSGLWRRSGWPQLWLLAGARRVLSVEEQHLNRFSVRMAGRLRLLSRLYGGTSAGLGPVILNIFLSLPMASEW